MVDLPDLSKLDLGAIMNMVTQLRDRMKQMEDALAHVIIETVVGGGLVTVKANGKGEIVAVAIDPELLAMNDRAMLESLIVAGVNQALAEASRRKEEEVQKMAGGLVLPGWFA